MTTASEQQQQKLRPCNKSQAKHEPLSDTELKIGYAIFYAQLGWSVQTFGVKTSVKKINHPTEYCNTTAF